MVGKAALGRSCNWFQQETVLADPGSSSLRTRASRKRDWLGKKSSRLDSASCSGKFRKRWATTEDLSFRTPDSRRPGPKSDTAPLPPSGCLIAARSCRTRGAPRPSHSRSEVLSLTRSDHGAVRQRPESRFDGKITVPGTSPPAPMCCIAAYQPHDSLHPACEGRHYRINSPRDSPIGLVVL